MRQNLLDQAFEPVAIKDSRVSSGNVAKGAGAGPKLLQRTQSFSGIGFKKKPMLSAHQMLQTSISR